MGGNMTEKRLPTNMKEWEDMTDWSDEERPKLLRNKIIGTIILSGCGIFLILGIISSPPVLDWPVLVQRYIYGFGIWLPGAPLIIFLLYVGIRQYRERSLLWGIAGGFIFLIGCLIISVMALTGSSSLSILIALIIMILAFVIVISFLDIIRGKLQERRFQREELGKE